MTNKMMIVRVWACLALVLCAALPLAADDIAAQGQAIVTQNENAVIQVALVLKVSMSFDGAGSEEEELKMEATGTVIGADGLTVVSLSNTDPMSLFAAMGEEDMKAQSRVTSAKMLLRDGQELKAQVVLRDKDLDLAFVRPTEKPAAPLAFVDLAKAAQPALLQPVVLLTRMGKVANRVTGVFVGRIAAVVEKPRRFYVPSEVGMSRNIMGSPVFTADGGMAGLMLLRAVKGGEDSMMGMGGQDNITPIILPASSITESAAQVPAWGTVIKEELPPPPAKPAAPEAAQSVILKDANK